MARVSLNQTSFTGGEISPRALGRTDIDRYATALKRARNCHPVITGGIKRREGSLYVAAAQSNTAGASVLVPFIKGRDQAWMLEFANLTCRIYTAAGALVTTLTSPYTAAMLSSIDWAQSESTLYLFHAEVPIQRLQLLGTGTWVLGAAPFTAEPFSEVGIMPATTVTLSLATVGVGRTATAGVATWVDGDIGRAIIYDAGIAVITGFTSSTIVTVTITRAFPSVNIASGTWTLEGSPQAFCKVTQKTPVGGVVALVVAQTRAATITLSSMAVGAGVTVTASVGVFTAGDVGNNLWAGTGVSAVTAFTSATQITVTITEAFTQLVWETGQWAMNSPAWRASDVGSFVRINTGLLKIASYTNSLEVRATILQEPTSTSLAPPLAWQLMPVVWTTALGYPRTGTVHQQRLIAAGTTKFPRTVWGSRLGEPLDFELGTTDDLAFAHTIDSDDASAIAYVTAGRDLVVLTESGEYSMRSGVEKPLTPTNVRVVPEANHGSAGVRPVLIGNETMFVQRAGRKLRSLGYRYDFDAYRAPDVTALADHLTRAGLEWMTFQQEPDLLLWAARGDGKFLTCTIDRDQQPSVVGWALHETQGAVECFASIPNGAREQVWTIARRTINAATVRLIERFDGTLEPLHPNDSDGRIYGCTVDCGLVVDNPAGQTVFTVAHLPNTTVRVVADGSEMGNYVTTGAGQFTLPRSAKRVLVGLHFESEAALLPPEFGTGEGSAQGNAARTGELSIKLLDTVGCSVVDGEGNAQQVEFRSFGANVLDEPPTPFTGVVRVSKFGWGRSEAPDMSITQPQALPWHVVSLVRKHTANG
jgi:hypothetical protein